MTKLEAAIEKLRAAPPELQEALAAQIEAALTPGGLLADEDLAEIAEGIDENEALVPHQDVMREIHRRFGK